MGFRLPLTLPSVEDLAIPTASFLIFFLAYTSQYLFYYIKPGPLSRTQAIWFNILVFAVWICYDRTCTVDPGRKGWINKGRDVSASEDEDGENVVLKKGQRWCKKCEAVKPPRAHHCRQCDRCIPKMDHHCPWTTNCVSHTTFPHFLRFVLYSVISMSVLMYHLFTRCMVIWNNRNLPAYLGPPMWAMAHLLVLLLVNSIALFALSILLLRTTYGLAINTTMIESWEIERHEALVERSRKTGGYVYANGGQRMRIERQEFPYDIGIWKNLCQGMGTANVLAWFLPFGGAPTIDSAVDYELNGFEDEGTTWPPPDPDKMPRAERALNENMAERHYETSLEEREAFKRRQKKDHERWSHIGKEMVIEEEDEDYDSNFEEGIDGEQGWTNSDGDRLRDYGVDEDAEVLAEDEIPLGELLRQRKARAAEL